MQDRRKAIQVLILNTIAFTICFAGWMMNGVLVTYLVDNDVFLWDKAQMGWLIGIPVLTGSLMRLPVGVLADKYGGRRVYTLLMLASAIPMFMTGAANEYYQFVFASLGFGLTGASFAVGIAYTSVWFSKERQGTALGIFGVGNAGSALTSMCAPFILRWLTDGGTNIEGWRMLPKLYAVALVIMAIIFYIFTYEKVAVHSKGFTLKQRLEPLKYMRVWRFGLYYFLVFGAFVALSQWLIPYYVNVYTMSVASAGLMAAIFSLPAGVIRALGGWMSDRFGARRVMYWVLSVILVGCALLVVPRMDIESPGSGVMAMRDGTVTFVSDSLIKVDQREYKIQPEPTEWRSHQEKNAFLIFPAGEFWHRTTVEVGEKVTKKQLLAKGITHLHFQANIWIFIFLVFVVGIMMGIGSAAVYRYIPDYYPEQVGVVGGIVGVVGGLGGFVCPILFGYMLKWTGLWTTSWMFLTVLAFVCLIWMHYVVQKMMHVKAPALMRQIEDRHDHPMETKPS